MWREVGCDARRSWEKKAYKTFLQYLLPIVFEEVPWRRILIHPFSTFDVVIHVYDANDHSESWNHNRLPVAHVSEEVSLDSVHAQILIYIYIYSQSIYMPILSIFLRIAFTPSSSPPTRLLRLYSRILANPCKKWEVDSEMVVANFIPNLRNGKS